MATSRSGAGGKIVSNRRHQRLAVTPYDRPPLQQPVPPPPKSPNWFTGIVVPSARALASGAGKILSTIFSESESSSSEDDDSGSEDDVDNDDLYESPHSGADTRHEKNVTPPETLQYGQETKLGAWRTETKRIIEQLISHETFSREECDRLIEVLKSQVVDQSTEARGKSLFLGSAGTMVDHEDADKYNKAIQEAKTWFQGKKVGSSSVTGLADGTHNLDSTALEHVESGGGSPVDVARSYMKERPPWASPTRNVELRTPLTTTMKLLKEGPMYSLGHDSLSPSKKRNSLSSGSWNIQEELRRVRSKATDDMLRTPCTKIDTSLLAVTKIKESIGAGKVAFSMGERTNGPDSLSKTNPIDALVNAGVSSDPPLAALASRLDDKTSGSCLKPATSVSGNNEDSEAVHSNGERAASRYPDLPGPEHAEENHADPHLSEINGPLATEAPEFGGKHGVTAVTSSKSSLSAGVGTEQTDEQHDEESNNTDTVNDINKSMNAIDVEGNCELLSEAYMEVPIVTETNSIASGSPNNLGMQREEKDKADIVTQKPQGRKSGKYNRKGRGRGK